MSPGLVVGLVVGIPCAVVLLALALWVCLRRRARAAPKARVAAQPSHGFPRVRPLGDPATHPRTGSTSSGVRNPSVSLRAAPVSSLHAVQSSYPEEESTGDIYEHMEDYSRLMNGRQGSLKYVPLDRVSLSQAATLKDQLFIQMDVVGGAYFAEIPADEAMLVNAPVFKRVYDEIDVAHTSPDNEESNTDDVYANAESILQALVISSEQLHLGRIIGSGAFGDVLEAEWRPRHQPVPVKVAVKRLKVSDDHMAQDTHVYAGFLKEMSTMAQLTHENIVRVLALTQDPPPLIVLEFIAGGSLYDWLRKAPRPPPVNLLLLMAQQTAKGLSYLADRSVVHRDVAARNVLISIESQTKFVCKLTDFGLSRVFDNLTYQSNKTATPIPVRWTALEGLFYFTFSEKSDVWAYGVLVWEMLTCCRVFPYDEHNDDVALVGLIEAGLRLPCPANAPPAVYALLQDCWNIEPDERPSFAAILSRLPGIIHSVLGAVGSVVSHRTPCYSHPYSSVAPAPSFPPMAVQPPRESYRMVDESTREDWRRSYASADVHALKSIRAAPAAAAPIPESARASVAGPRELYTAVRKSTFSSDSRAVSVSVPAASRPIAKMPVSSPPPALTTQSSTGALPVLSNTDVAATDLTPLSETEINDIRQWMKLELSRQQAEAFLGKVYVATCVLIRLSLPHRAPEDGVFLIRKSKGERQYVLSLSSTKKGFQHYKIQGLDSQRVALIDQTNGNREFGSVEELVMFYKVLSPKAKGGLASRLSDCIPSSLF